MNNILNLNECSVDRDKPLIQVWGVTLDASLLSEKEIHYIQTLPKEIPDMQWVCNELDRVWFSMGLDNKSIISSQLIGEYYRHPVWLMNGLFSGTDKASITHRKAIAEAILNYKPKLIADYGGGYGELARIIAESDQSVEVHIIEPFPNEMTLKRLNNYKNIKFKHTLLENKYDVIVAQDVLEHTGNPVEVAYNLASHLNIDGKIVFANCFSPIIQCHLPQTFHLRHTFKSVMKSMGLRFVTNVTNAVHAQIFDRGDLLSLEEACKKDEKMRRVGAFINKFDNLIDSLKRFLHRFI
jgi:2-polyprenyl-3-methyl-5-hydroxy-6-metoxy-1,4-benzoquinol methylase